MPSRFGGSDRGEIALRIVWLVIFAGLAAFSYCAVQEGNRNDAIRVNETTKLWNDWIAYRDANCHVTEKMFGLSETSGKFHQNDNATVYDCVGVKYVIAESIENAAKSKDLQIWQIPKIEKK